jgi:hypothetical protein
MRRSPHAEGVLKTATRQLGQKKGSKHTFPQLKEWERTGDPRRRKMTPSTITHRAMLMIAEDWETVSRLRAEGYDHVHKIDRATPPDSTATVKGTHGF